MTNSPPRNVLEVADLVERLIEEADQKVGKYHDAPDTWHARHNRAMVDIADQLTGGYAAIIRPSWDGARVRMLGIAASSTSGVRQALRNWVAAARRREGGQ
ncbi:MAG: hypothetical protein IT472_08980 [Thermomonas sp.]|uniref:hypothetical protein n=1 Tax=Thermomonas sp. TaxID=1971895 RepID=UPI0026061C1A|nr:hypothetical protein [Thermomonas sp.]MCC7097299.1 hypothetical protein [Thermomonas sp.]